MIFSRKRGGDGHDRVSDQTGPPEHTWEASPHEPLPVPEFGPYDSSVAPDDDLSRIALGALHVPNLPGNALQVEASPNGQIVRVQLEHKGSRLQLSVFAAPRTEGIWDEVRADLRTTLATGGGKVVEVEGEYGPQLAARLPGPGGSGVVEVRHVGIDGPRWFVHAVFVGPAAVDSELAAPLRAVLQGLVVNRGDEARPVKEALPLQLPPELAARLADAAAQQGAAQQAAAQQTAAQQRAAAQQTAAQPRAAAQQPAAAQPPATPSKAASPTRAAAQQKAAQPAARPPTGQRAAAQPSAAVASPAAAGRAGVRAEPAAADGGEDPDAPARLGRTTRTGGSTPPRKATNRRGRGGAR